MFELVYTFIGFGKGPWQPEIVIIFPMNIIKGSQHAQAICATKVYLSWQVDIIFIKQG